MKRKKKKKGRVLMPSPAFVALAKEQPLRGRNKLCFMLDDANWRLEK